MSLGSSLLINVFVNMITGNLINWLLHGVLTVQIYLYYLAFPNDRTWMKVAVYTTYILEIIQTIGIGTTVILILLKGGPYPASFDFASYQSHHEYEWSVKSMMIRMFGGLVPLIAQSTYAHRIRVMTQRKIIPGLIIVLAILQLTAAIVTTTTSAHPSTILYAIWTGLNVLNDLIVAIAMTRILSTDQHWSCDTRMKVNRLFHLIIATGSSIVAVNILSIILLFINGCVIRGFTGSIGATFMPKLYANSMLVMLNNRMTIRNPMKGSTNTLSTLKIADHRPASSDSAMSCNEMGTSTSAVWSPV